jgi:hypothetical protein
MVTDASSKPKPPPPRRLRNLKKDDADIIGRVIAETVPEGKATQIAKAIQEAQKKKKRAPAGPLLQRFS